MRRLANIALGLVAALALHGPARSQVAQVTGDWVTMRPPGQGFRMLMPPGWEQATPRGPNVKLVIRSTPAANAGRVGVANCNVVVRTQPETRAMTQAQINAEVAGGPLAREDALAMVDFMSQPQLLESRVARINNIPAYFVVARGGYENLNAKTTNTVAIGVVMQPGRSHAFSCTAGAAQGISSEAAWNSWRPVIMAIMGSAVLEDY